MKISKDHLDYINVQLNCLGYKQYISMYQTGQFHNANKVKDLNKRFRWDMFNLAGLGSFACRELYDYLDDRHIDSALKSLIPNIKV